MIRARAALRLRNLEVIFVDDNSNDNSVAVARHAALSVSGSGRDSDRVRIFPSPRRNGKASSLNIAIRMARGEFIAVTDADSVIQYRQHPALAAAVRRSACRRRRRQYPPDEHAGQPGHALSGTRIRDAVLR